MTKEEILAMDEEQLKRLIATEVMKLRIYHYDKDHPDNCYFMLMDEELGAVANDVPFTMRNGERKTEEEAWKDCPDYSTDISAAWEVMQKFSNPVGARVAFGYFIKEIAQLERNVELHDMSVMWSLTPVNICKAALLNVMDWEESS